MDIIGLKQNSYLITKDKGSNIIILAVFYILNINRMIEIYF